MDNIVQRFAINALAVWTILAKCADDCGEQMQIDQFSIHKQEAEMFTNGCSHCFEEEFIQQNLSEEVHLSCSCKYFTRQGHKGRIQIFSIPLQIFPTFRLPSGELLKNSIFNFT